jgi:hypothetical protein
MTLDTAGQRANETGWTDEALRRERELERQARKERRQAEGKAKAAARGDFWMRNLKLALAIAGSIGTAAWEWVNTGRGWQDLYPALGWLPYVGAAGAILLFFISCHEALEELAKTDDPDIEADPKKRRNLVKLVGWSLSAFAMYAICVIGVFVATATQSVKTTKAARDSRVAYAKLLGERDAVELKLETQPIEYWDEMMIRTKDAIVAQENLAKGSHAMPDLDPNGGCAQKLNFNQRRLCAIVNGGVDEFTGERIPGMRAELRGYDRGMKAAKEQMAKLADLNAQLDNFQILTGDETAEAIGGMFGKAGPGEQSNNEAAMGWLLLALSSLFLAASGWAVYWVFTTLEQKRLAALAANGRTA